MKGSFWPRVASLVLFTLALSLTVARCVEDRETERRRSAFEAEARQAVMAEAGDLPEARLISIKSSRYVERACGWAQLSPSVGAVPFLVMGSRTESKSALVFLPRLDASEPAVWAEAMFDKELVLQFCIDGDRPPTPENVHRAPVADAAVRSLWSRNGSRWATLPLSDGGFIALGRGAGNRLFISPAFSDQADARRWASIEGAEAMRRACLERRRPNDAAARRC